MLSSLGCLLLCGSIALALGNAQKLPKGKRPNLKVHINTTSDSILLKFLRPNPNVKLEGFLLGYGSNLSPNQYFPLPAEGKHTEAVVDAEPKYLIVVRPAPPPSQKKSCSGKARSRKPLQLVVGTLSPSSVFLSWGFLINPHHDWTLPSHCPNDRYYTIRYREKDKEKKWVFQLCPATETIVENLKPNTVYEFGVKDNVEGGIWSKIFNHKTIVGSKSKVNGKIQSTYDQAHTVPAYVPRKLIPITVIKQVIQNVTHRASTKSPDKTPFGGTILVHLIIPGLNETTVKLPTSIMLEISDAIKTQLAKNETLALPAESKTPEVEKIPARPVTVTPESVPRTTKPTVSSALDFSEKTLVLSERTPETLQTILIPRFELSLSTLAPKRLPEFPQAKTPFPFEKPGGTLASIEKPWIVPTSKIYEDSKPLPPQTATYDVFSSPTTSDEPDISEPHTETSDPFLDSVPPKTSRTLEQPRATLAPSETPFVPQKLEIFTSPEMPPTTPATQQTTSIPSTPKRRIRPKKPRTKPERTTSPGIITSKIPKSPEPTWTTLAPSKTQFISLKPKIPLIPEAIDTKPAPEPQTLPPSQSTIGPETPETKPSTTLASPKTKRPGRRPRPKTTPSPDVPKSKPALEPATVQPELLVPTVASKPSKRPKTTHRPDAPQIQPDSKPPKQLLPKPQTTEQPDMPPTKPVFDPATFETEAPSTTIVPATDLEPVTLRTEAPRTTLAPKTTQRTRTRRPRPKHKTTQSPAVSQTKLATTTKRPRRPRPKTKTTPHPEVPQTKLVPTTVFEPVFLRTEAPGTTLVPAIIFEPVTPMKETPGTTFVPVTDLEPVTVRTETSGTTLATKMSQRPRRPRPRPKTTPSSQVPQTKSASKTTQQTRHPRPRPKTTPSLEVSQSKPAPKQIPRASPKPKTSPRPRIPQTQPARKVPQRVTSKPKTSPSPEVSYTPPVPRDVVLPPKPDPEVSQREPAPLETRGSPFIPMISPSTSQEELQSTLAETEQSTQEFFTTKIPPTTELTRTTQAPHRLYTTPVRPRTSEKAHIRPALNKTTTRPSRLKPSGTPKGNGMGAGVKQAPKPSGAGKDVSVDSTHITKKPAPIPGTRRPPLPPRPVPPRRKPLPPNNVTGKPGSAGIISSGRVTSPPLTATFRPTEAPSEKTETDEKQPTVPASGEDLGNVTDFSSSPTRETDPLGKPRFKGPHVRYIQKPDNRPCSITDSVKRFPKEDATEGNATSPPQNPPTNLTVVTVEGCPSFVILDWEKPLNDTVTEYEVISRENGSFSGKNKSIQITNQTFSTVENLKPDTSYEFQVKPKNPLGEGPASNTVAFSTESADPRVSEPVSAGRDAIWTERPFNSDSYSECKGKQYVKRTWYKKFVGVQLCNSLRYKIYLSDSLTGKFYNIGDQRGHGEDHCQFVDSFLDGRTGQQLTSDQLPTKEGYFRAVRQEPVQFGEIGGHTQINYVQWYECGTTIPGKW
ncbi:target of Nesh-SH3 isoform X41 [Prionailurus bengalensis]|uniref:target of Nesh-SH3 isoform X41 n=1 Tax=Prionailurus bengalensis TaxID=37029 RepID=UPI001CA82402|nr:target of Nesh-SH3 isoform X41 [Prionailurus bengalensis]